MVSIKVYHYCNLLSILCSINRSDKDTGKHYRIWEERGEQKGCQLSGQLIKPFDPNLTGKYKYNRRL